MGWVQWNVGSASLQHAEHTDNHVERTIGEQRYQHVRSDAEVAQAARHGIRTPIQLAVGQHGAVEYDRDCIGLVLDLRRKQLVDALHRGSRLRH
ncbi:MAG: hypothetical protein WDN69_26470 [Aliidongia sp.]